MLERIPGRLNERRTPLGELNWIFTAITDTIAWNVLPRPLFKRLFRQDLLLASLMRNFLLAERIMRSANCTPVSEPPLPKTHEHPLWQAWDYTVEQCLAQLPELIAADEAAAAAAAAAAATTAARAPPSPANGGDLGGVGPPGGGAANVYDVQQHQQHQQQQLAQLQQQQQQPSPIQVQRGAPQIQPMAAPLTSNPYRPGVGGLGTRVGYVMDDGLDGNEQPLQLSDSLPVVEPFVYQHNTFFEDEMTAFSVWLRMGPAYRKPPEQLPIVLQVLLSQVHRVRALDLLARFLQTGPVAIDLALSVGIFPYVLRLLQSSALDPRAPLVFIWAKVLAVDGTCRSDLVKENGQEYFAAFLASPEATSLPVHTALAAYVLATVAYPDDALPLPVAAPSPDSGEDALALSVASGAAAMQAAAVSAAAVGPCVLPDSVPDSCVRLLASSPSPLVRRWAALCLECAFKAIAAADGSDGSSDETKQPVVGAAAGSLPPPVPSPSASPTLPFSFSWMTSTISVLLRVARTDPVAAVRAAVVAPLTSLLLAVLRPTYVAAALDTTALVGSATHGGDAYVSPLTGGGGAVGYSSSSGGAGGGEAPGDVRHPRVDELVGRRRPPGRADASASDNASSGGSSGSAESAGVGPPAAPPPSPVTSSYSGDDSAQSHSQDAGHHRQTTSFGESSSGDSRPAHVYNPSSSAVRDGPSISSNNASGVYRASGGGGGGDGGGAIGVGGGGGGDGREVGTGHMHGPGVGGGVQLSAERQSPRSGERYCHPHGASGDGGDGGGYARSPPTQGTSPSQSNVGGGALHASTLRLPRMAAVALYDVGVAFLRMADGDASPLVRREVAQVLSRMVEEREADLHAAAVAAVARHPGARGRSPHSPSSSSSVVGTAESERSAGSSGVGRRTFDDGGSYAVEGLRRSLDHPFGPYWAALAALAADSHPVVAAASTAAYATVLSGVAGNAGVARSHGRPAAGVGRAPALRGRDPPPGGTRTSLSAVEDAPTGQAPRPASAALGAPPHSPPRVPQAGPVPMAHGGPGGSRRRVPGGGVGGIVPTGPAGPATTAYVDMAQAVAAGPSRRLRPPRPPEAPRVAGSSGASDIAESGAAGGTDSGRRSGMASVMSFEGLNKLIFGGSRQAGTGGARPSASAADAAAAAAAAAASAGGQSSMQAIRSTSLTGAPCNGTPALATSRSFAGSGRSSSFSLLASALSSPSSPRNSVQQAVRRSTSADGVETTLLTSFNDVASEDSPAVEREPLVCGPPPPSLYSWSCRSVMRLVCDGPPGFEDEESGVGETRMGDMGEAFFFRHSVNGALVPVPVGPTETHEEVRGAGLAPGLPPVSFPSEGGAWNVSGDEAWWDESEEDSDVDEPEPHALPLPAGRTARATAADEAVARAMSPLGYAPAPTGGAEIWAMAFLPSVRSFACGGSSGRISVLSMETFGAVESSFHLPPLPTLGSTLRRGESPLDVGSAVDDAGSLLLRRGAGLGRAGVGGLGVGLRPPGSPPGRGPRPAVNGLPPGVAPPCEVSSPVPSSHADGTDDVSEPLESAGSGVGVVFLSAVASVGSLLLAGGADGRLGVFRRRRVRTALGRPGSGGGGSGSIAGDDVDSEDGVGGGASGGGAAPTSVRYGLVSSFRASGGSEVAASWSGVGASAAAQGGGLCASWDDATESLVAGGCERGVVRQWDLRSEVCVYTGRVLPRGETPTAVTVLADSAGGRAGSLVAVAGIAGTVALADTRVPAGAGGIAGAGGSGRGGAVLTLGAHASAVVSLSQQHFGRRGGVGGGAGGVGGGGGGGGGSGVSGGSSNSGDENLVSASQDGCLVFWDVRAASSSPLADPPSRSVVAGWADGVAGGGGGGGDGSGGGGDGGGLASLGGPAVVNVTVAHSSELTCMATWPGSSVVATGSDNQSVKLFGGHGNWLRMFRYSHDKVRLGHVSSLAFHPTDGVLAVGSENASVTFYH